MGTYEEILYTLRKNPSFKKYIIKYKNFNINILIEIVNLYKQNKNFLTIDFNKNPEELFDYFYKTINEQKFRKTIKKQLSSKYKKLLNKKNFNLLRKIYLQSIKYDELIFLNIFKNIYLLQSQEEFNIFLKQYYFFHFNLSKEKIIKNIDNVHLKKYSLNNNILIVEILSYEGMKKIGSSSWCIFNSPDFFDHYLENLDRQFIIFNFNFKDGNPKKIIGVTVDINGNILYEFDNNNNLCNYYSNSIKFKKEKINDFILRNNKKTKNEKLLKLCESDRFNDFVLLLEKEYIIEDELINLIYLIENSNFVKYDTIDNYILHILNFKKHSSNFYTKFFFYSIHNNNNQSLSELLKIFSFNKTTIYAGLYFSFKYQFIDLFNLLRKHIKQPNHPFLNIIKKEINKSSDREYFVFL